jgi:hypothetical protein
MGGRFRGKGRLRGDQQSGDQYSGNNCTAQPRRFA